MGSNGHRPQLENTAMMQVMADVRVTLGARTMEPDPDERFLQMVKAFTQVAEGVSQRNDLYRRLVRLMAVAAEWAAEEAPV